MSAADRARIAGNLARVHDRIAAAGGDPALVRVVAMTKGHGAAVVEAACEAGLRDLGENYAQELRGKLDRLDLPDDLRWHFTGRVQTNKVRTLAGRVWCWHSVDRGALVDEMGRRDRGARILVQVRPDEAAGRAGVAAPEVSALVAHAGRAGLEVRGLMAMGVEGDVDATAAVFSRVAALADRLGLPERSMGMSTDLELAVAAGATMVRVGTALFGPRPAAAGPP